MSTSDDALRRMAHLRAELIKWRTRRGLSLRALGSTVGCDHSQLWKIEHGKTTVTRAMVEAYDHALDARGALVAAWRNAHGHILPAQLPAVPGQVVGRDLELAAADTALRAARMARPDGVPLVVAIDGPAGVGKTTLALRWAHQVAGDHLDGQLYTDLRAFTPTSEPVGTDVVLAEFLTALAVSPVPTGLPERAALFRSLLTDRKVLIVLDDADNLADIQALLPGSSGCTVVVTSRRALSGLVAHHGGLRITLEPLTEHHSRTMVTSLIGHRRAHAEPDAVTALTRLCGHLPLALRIVAEHVATYPHRLVADLVDDLTDPTTNTDNPHDISANRDPDDAQGGWIIMTNTEELRAAFSGSYRRLTPEAARLFRLLGLYPGTNLPVPAAAALAGATLPHTRRLLHELRSLHLVTIQFGQVVRLHPLIHAYARHLTTTALNHPTDHDTDHDTDHRIDHRMDRGADCGTDEGDTVRAAVGRLASWYLTAADTASQRLLHACPELAPRDTPPRIGRDDAPNATDTDTGTNAGTAADPTAIFADAPARSAWRDAESVTYRSVLRMALVHDPRVTAPRLAAELGRLALLQLTHVRGDQPADPPVATHVLLTDAPDHTAPNDSPDRPAGHTGRHVPRPGHAPRDHSWVAEHTPSAPTTPRARRDPLPLSARSSRPLHGQQRGGPPRNAASEELWDVPDEDSLVRLLHESAARLGLAAERRNT